MIVNELFFLNFVQYNSKLELLYYCMPRIIVKSMELIEVYVQSSISIDQVFGADCVSSEFF